MTTTTTIKTDKTTPGLFGQSYRVHMDKIERDVCDVSGCARLLQRLMRGPLNSDQAMEIQSLGAAMEALSNDLLNQMESLNRALYDDKIVGSLMGPGKYDDDEL